VTSEESVELRSAKLDLDASHHRATERAGEHRGVALRKPIYDREGVDALDLRRWCEDP